MTSIVHAPVLATRRMFCTRSALYPHIIQTNRCDDSGHVMYPSNSPRGLPLSDISASAHHEVTPAAMLHPDRKSILWVRIFGLAVCLKAMIVILHCRYMLHPFSVRKEVPVVHISDGNNYFA